MKEKYVGSRLVELLLASLVVCAFAASSCLAAQINTPEVGDNQLAPTDAPCRMYSVAQSSGTSEVLIVSSAAYINYVVMSTGTADGTVYLTLKDTSVLAGGTSGSSDVMRLYFGSASQETVRTFSPPPLFTRGVTLTKSAASEWASICVRTLFGQIP